MRPILFLASLFILSTACASPPIEPSQFRYVTLHTAAGDIVVRLYAEKAPNTVKNFIQHVVAGDYQGGSFYRSVTKDNENNPAAPIQVMQGGARKDVQANGIPLEGTFQTGIHHRNGVISMARAESTDSGSTEFFICVGDQPNLDEGQNRSGDKRGFAAFGKVVSDMRIVRGMQKLPTQDPYNMGVSQYLVSPVLIKSATLENHPPQYLDSAP